MYTSRLFGTHVTPIFCNALVHVIYSKVSDQCSHAILLTRDINLCDFTRCSLQCVSDSML